MPKTKRTNKNCQLCRRAFKSAKRFTILKEHTKNGVREDKLIVCGECKSNIHNWHKKKIAQHHYTSKVHIYRVEQCLQPITVYGREFAFESWVSYGETLPLSIFKKLKRISSRKRGVAAKYGSSYRCKKVWQEEAAASIRKAEKLEEDFKKANKGWTQEQLKEYRQMVTHENHKRKEEEQLIMCELEKELFEPLLNWMSKNESTNGE